MVRRIWLVVVAAFLLGACGTSQTGAGGSASTSAPASTNAPASVSTSAPASVTTSAPASTSAPTGDKPLREVTMAMPYIPNVQFAYYYEADKKGYYAAEGLKVKFDYNFETDVVQRIAQDTVQFGQASGDSVLLARAQGLPIVSVAAASQTFATVFFSKAEANITKPEDLKGKSVGIPGRFGASYIGLQALLYANKMQESDLNIQEIGFAQVPALTENKVQVASGYGNNEPVQLEQQGIKVNVIRVADAYPLASDGIITSEKMVAEQPEVVRAFIRATLKGMQDVIRNPDEAFATSLTYIPELKNTDQALQRKVLQATLAYWQSDNTKQNGLGYADKKQWDATHTFLRDSKLLKQDVDVTKAFTNEYLK